MSDDPVSRVRITKRNDRGFHQYGKDSTCTYGTTIRVYESSSAEGPHLWLELQNGDELMRKAITGYASAHLNQQQAEYLIRRLQTWVDEIPKRWGKP